MWKRFWKFKWEVLEERADIYKKSFLDIEDKFDEELCYFEIYWE